MPNKVGGLKLLFICAGLGLILLGAGCTPKTEEDANPEVVNVPAEEMIAIPWKKDGHRLSASLGVFRWN